jgi:hypothetical protein
MCEILSLASLLCLSCSIAAAGRYEYYSRDRSTMIIFDDGKAYVGANPDQPNPAGAEARRLHVLTLPANHRMANGRCVSYQHITFAAYAGMSVGDTYRCNGIQFRVERCRSSDSPCSEFIVSAACGRFEQGECHYLDSGEASLTYSFVYNRSRGLVSVDFASETPGNPAVLTLAGAYGLVLE